MGLPGAGKTTLADEMAPFLNAKRLNADEVRMVPFHLPKLFYLLRASP
jgi:predicted kinase